MTPVLVFRDVEGWTCASLTCGNIYANSLLVNELSAVVPGLRHKIRRTQSHKSRKHSHATSNSGKLEKSCRSDRNQSGDDGRISCGLGHFLMLIQYLLRLGREFPSHFRFLLSSDDRCDRPKGSDTEYGRSQSGQIPPAEHRGRYGHPCPQK